MFKKIVIIGFANLLLGITINFLVQWFLPSIALEYQNESIFRPWSDPLMIIFFAYPFILAWASSYVWDLIEKKVIGASIKKALYFAKFYFIIATIPGMFISYTTFHISFLMIVIWSLTGFMEAFLAGILFANIKK